MGDDTGTHGGHLDGEHRDIRRRKNIRNASRSGLASRPPGSDRRKTRLSIKGNKQTRGSSR